jgi:hypothetical protein
MTWVSQRVSPVVMKVLSAERVMVMSQRLARRKKPHDCECD